MYSVINVERCRKSKYNYARKFANYFFHSLEQRIIFLIIAIGFRILLETSYKDFVHPMFEYAGFSLVENYVKYAESWFIYLGVIGFLPHKAKRPSDYLLCIASFSYLTPLLVFYGLADKPRWALYFVIFQYVLMVIFRMGRPIPIRPLRNGALIARWTSYAAVIAATLWMLAAVGLSSFNLDLASVYEYRENANKQIYTGFLGYVAVWATTVFAPFLIMLALRRQQIFVLVGFIILYVFWFGMTSHKAILFTPILIFSLFFLFNYSRALSIIPLGYSLVVIVSIFSYQLVDSMLLSSLFIRRFFFVSSQLTFVYMDFFDINEYVMWSNSILSWLIKYPYDVSVALVIGKHLNDPDLWANNSFFSTGYMHAGIIGVVIYGAFTGMILRFLDAFAAKGVPLWICLAIVIVPFNSLFRSADLTTTLLTNGLGLGLLILYLYSHNEWIPNKKIPNV